MAGVMIVIAPDSFKESLTAAEAAAAMARGAQQAGYTDVVCIPMSDGGEGFLDCLLPNAERRGVRVHDPLGREREAQFVLDDDRGAFECAVAVGLAHLSADERDVLASSSRGVGELLLAALDAGATEVTVGLGGSATNDGGAGLLAAVGVRLLDRQGNPVDPTPRGLAALASVDASGLDPRLQHVTLTAACDVTNPLCGPDGATATFGPQKGVEDAEIAALDERLATLAHLLDADELAERPGTGAAGGLGFALALLGAELRPGFDLVAEATGLAQHLADADLVLTGEGSFDAQSLQGKLVGRLIEAAGNARVLVFAGRVTPAHGIDATCITPDGDPDPHGHAAANLERAVDTRLQCVPVDGEGRGVTR